MACSTSKPVAHPTKNPENRSSSSSPSCLKSSCPVRSAFSLPTPLVYHRPLSKAAFPLSSEVNGFEGSTTYEHKFGGENIVQSGYTKGDGLRAEIVGIFVLVYTVFTATVAKRNARDSHVSILAPLPIGFAVFLVHFATILITRTGINSARSLGTTIIYNKARLK